MTAQTTDFSGLLYYNPISNGFNPVESASLTCTANPVNEGQTNTFNIVTWGIPDGTTIYWKLNGATNLLFSRFDNQRGTVTITNNRASFTLTASANNTTAPGAQYYSVAIGKTFGGTDLAILDDIVVNDTSQSAPGSLAFSNGGYLEVQGTTSDWALGITWTMEWWGKADRASAENRLMAVFGQNLTQPSIDIFQQRGKLYLGKSSYTEIGPEPTPGVWTHVAIVSNAGTVTVYHNGTSVYGPTAVGYDLTNSTDKLYVGVRSQGNSPITPQAFSGQLTGIRITNTAVYSGTFDPLTASLPPAKVTGTKLLINPTYAAPFLDASDSAHTLPGQNVSISEYYPLSVQLTSGTSLSFSGSNQDVQVSGTPTDWALGDTWTVEWWEKIPVGNSGFCGVMSQDSNQLPYAGFDIFHAAGNIQLFNGAWTFTEPTQGVWNHIAIQKNGLTVTAYVNGVSTSISANMNYGVLSNSSLDLVIGLRTANGASPGYSQWFVGQLANIRISSVARYSGKFTPPTTLVVDANTKLALDGSAGGMLFDACSRVHGITNNGTIVTQIGTTYTGTSGFAAGSPLSYIILASFGDPFNTNYPAPGDLTGWTVTGGGISGSATVTGNTQDLGGGTLHIPIDQSFLQQTGEYIFTAP
jgi:hypothetical protein